MELKFRVYSRSQSKKRWNEKWKITLTGGEEFHVTDQLLKMKGAEPTIVCAFYLQDGSLYFQMRDENHSALVNGVARTDAVVGKGDKIVIGELAEILVLTAPQASSDGPTLTDAGGTEEGDGPTIAMEPTESSGVSADEVKDPAPSMDLGDIPDIAEPTTFMQTPKKSGPLAGATSKTAPSAVSRQEEPTGEMTTGELLLEEPRRGVKPGPVEVPEEDQTDEAIPEIGERQEISRAGLRSILEATRTGVVDDPDKTPPLGTPVPSDLPFEYASHDSLQDTSEEAQELTKKTEAMPPSAKSKPKTKSKFKPGKFFGKPAEEKIELQDHTVTDVALGEDAGSQTGAYHVPPSKDQSAESNEITKTISRLSAKASDVTGALTKKLRNWTSPVAKPSAPPSKPPKAKKPARPAPSSESIDLTGTGVQKNKAYEEYTPAPRPEYRADEGTADGIIAERGPRAHPSELARAAENTKKKRSSVPGKVLYLGGGFALSIFAFFLVWVLLKPTENTPIQSLSRPAGQPIVINLGLGGNGGATAVPVAGGVQPGGAVVHPGNNSQSSVGSSAGTPPPVFKNSANPVVQANAQAPRPSAAPQAGMQPAKQGIVPPTNASPVAAARPTLPPAPVPPKAVTEVSSAAGLPRGIPIEELVKKVQRLRAPPSAPATQGSSR